MDIKQMSTHFNLQTSSSTQQQSLFPLILLSYLPLIPSTLIPSTHPSNRLTKYTPLGIFKILHTTDDCGIKDSSKNLRVLWVRALLNNYGEINDDIAGKLLPSTSGLVTSEYSKKVRTRVGEGRTCWKVTTSGDFKWGIDKHTSLKPPPPPHHRSSSNPSGSSESGLVPAQPL